MACCLPCFQPPVPGRVESPKGLYIRPQTWVEDDGPDSYSIEENWLWWSGRKKYFLSGRSRRDDMGKYAMDQGSALFHGSNMNPRLQVTPQNAKEIAAKAEEKKQIDTYGGETKSFHRWHTQQLDLDLLWFFGGDASCSGLCSGPRMGPDNECSTAEVLLAVVFPCCAPAWIEAHHPWTATHVRKDQDINYPGYLDDKTYNLPLHPEANNASNGALGLACGKTGFCGTFCGTLAFCPTLGFCVGCLHQASRDSMRQQIAWLFYGGVGALSNSHPHHDGAGACACLFGGQQSLYSGSIGAGGMDGLDFYAPSACCPLPIPCLGLPCCLWLGCGSPCMVLQELRAARAVSGMLENGQLRKWDLPYSTYAEMENKEIELHNEKVQKQNTKNAAKRKQQAIIAQRAAEKPAPAAEKGAKIGEETVFHDVDAANNGAEEPNAKLHAKYPKEFNGCRYTHGGKYETKTAFVTYGASKNTEKAWKCDSAGHDPHKGRYRQLVEYRTTPYLSKDGKEIPDTWGKVYFCDTTKSENKKYGNRNFWAMEVYEMWTVGGVDKVCSGGGRVAIAFSEALDPSEIEPNAWIECPNEQRYIPYSNGNKAGGVPKFHFFDPPWN